MGRDPDHSSSQIKSNPVVNLVQEIYIDRPLGYVEGVVAVVPCVLKFPYYILNPPQACDFGSQLFEVEVLNALPFVI